MVDWKTTKVCRRAFSWFCWRHSVDLFTRDILLRSSLQHMQVQPFGLPSLSLHQPFDLRDCNDVGQMVSRLGLRNLPFINASDRNLRKQRCEPPIVLRSRRPQSVCNALPASVGRYLVLASGDGPCICIDRAGPNAERTEFILPSIYSLQVWSAIAHRHNLLNCSEVPAHAIPCTHVQLSLKAWSPLNI